MHEIPLTKGETALVSPEDFDWLSEMRWCFAPGNGYAVSYYQDEFGRNKTWYMHRLVMQRMLGASIPKGLQVDHISGATADVAARIDNRRENLRLATRSQNQAAKGLQTNNTSHYKGVTFNQGKWEARIRYQGRRLNLGRYDDPLSAAVIFVAASRLLNLEFDGINFPDSVTSPCVGNQLVEILSRYQP